MKDGNEPVPVTPPDGGLPDGESPSPAAPSAGADQFLEIGGSKYTPDQARELIEAGTSYRELKGKYPDVDFGGMVPAFTQQRQILSDSARLQAYYAEKFGQQQPQGQQLDLNRPEVREAAEFLGQWARSQGYMTREEYDREQQQKAFESGLDALEKEIDGKDGRPKFDRVKVLQYMQKNPVYDPAVAYEALNSAALREWFAAKKLGNKPKGVRSETGGAGIPIVTKGKGPKFGTPEFAQAVEKAIEQDAE